MTKEHYYLAAQADEIYLDPLGSVLIDGYARYRLFYKDALDKLGVDINVFRVGKYKSAEEEYTRTTCPPRTSRKAARISTRSGRATRSGDAGAQAAGGCHQQATSTPLAKTVPAAGGNAAQVALEAGLVTGIKHKHEVEKRIIDLVGEDDTTGRSSRSTSRLRARGAR